MPKKKKKNKLSNTYKIVLAVLITALSVSGIFLIIYAWNILGFSSKDVFYTSVESDVIGTFPEKRRFKPGAEVVVRSGSISKSNCKFIGWKDVNKVIASTGGILENGTVFIMPERDVRLEAVWEEESASTSNDSDVFKDKKSSSASEDSTPIILKKIETKDYINLRDDCNYNSEILAEISDSDTQIKYYGKSTNIHDEENNTTYTWYFVKVPSLKKEGWIRSDMLTDIDDSKNTIYYKSSSYDFIDMYEKASTSSEIIETIDNDKTELHFLDKTKKTEDSDGDTTTWYLMENSKTKKTGWIQKNKLEERID